MKKTALTKGIGYRLLIGCALLATVVLLLWQRDGQPAVPPVATELTAEEAQAVEYLWITEEDRRMLVDVVELPTVRDVIQAGKSQLPEEAAGLARVRLPRGARLLELSFQEDMLLLEYEYGERQIQLTLLPGGVNKTVTHREDREVNIYVNEDNREFQRYNVQLEETR